MTKLERAAQAIGAIRTGSNQWSHYDDATGAWWQVTTRELRRLCDYLDSRDITYSRDAYSHWCASTCAVQMPKGWEPGL